MPAPAITNPVVSLDPAHPVDPKPLIADILRTRYCIPGSVFLVEHIDRRVPVPVTPPQQHVAMTSGGERSRKRRRGERRRERIVRLLLGDGELCIQALVRPEIHCFVDAGIVYEGCYVRVDKFELRWVDVEAEAEAEAEGHEVEDDGVGDPEVLERASGERWRRERERRKDKKRMVYLLVGDMVTVGWNEEYLEILRREKEREKEREEGEAVGDADEGQTAATAGYEGNLGGRGAPDEPVVDEEPAEAPEVAPTEEGAATGDQGPAAAASKPPPPAKQDDLDYISDSDDAFETLVMCAEKAEPNRAPSAAPPDPRQELQAAIVAQNQKQRQLENDRRPWMTDDPTKPVRLTPLSAIPHLPYRQNWMVNVLAVVVSLSDVGPSHLRPHRQRTARLADPTTAPGRHVHLTVFLEPERFTPAPGSVVLLLGVKNHLFDGGSLRKYVSDRPRNGSSWWVQLPDAPGWWCAEEAARLREWWRSVSAA